MDSGTGKGIINTKSAKKDTTVIERIEEWLTGVKSRKLFSLNFLKNCCNCFFKFVNVATAFPIIVFKSLDNFSIF